MRTSRLLALAIFVVPTIVNAEDKFSVPGEISMHLQQKCLECHDQESAEGGIHLESIDKLSEDDRLGLLNKVQEQVFFGLMPPPDAEKSTENERFQLLAWISKELGKKNASKLNEKLRRPEFGNYVDHEKLFSGKHSHLPGSTRDRRWLVSEFIFNAKINQLINHSGVRTIDGIKMNVIGDNGVNLGTRFGGHNLRQSITNPFLLPSKIGVRYYDTTTLSCGHLLTMISNAKKIAAYMASEEAMKVHYPAMYRVMKKEFAHRRILTNRKLFLNDYADVVLKELYGEKNRSFLPQFKRIKVAPINELVDAKGHPIPKESNMELLHRRYDQQDIQAIYRGIQKYKKAGVSYEQVIEACERDWFYFGVNEERLEGRVSLMTILGVRWDMSLIYDDVKKRNMALPPFEKLPESEMKEINRSILKLRRKGDRYCQIIEKCLADWEAAFKEEREQGGVTSDKNSKSVSDNSDLIADLVDELFATMLERKPSLLEQKDYVALAQKYMKSLNSQPAIAKLVETLILSSELVYRKEFGDGPADKHGRRLMSPRDASYALAFALTDSSPDKELADAASNGRLNSREDYRREVKRMLKRRDQFYVIDETVQKAGFNASITNLPIRKLRFFREFFGYPKAMSVFKDDERFGASGHSVAVSRLVDETDLLVQYILKRDQRVFEELLTTEKYYVFHSGDDQAMKASSDRLRNIYDYFKVHDWANFSQEELYEHWPFIKKMKMRGTVFPDFETNERRRSGWVRSFKTHMASLEERLGKGQKAAIPYDAIPMAYWHKGHATGRTGQVMRGHEVTTYFNIDFRDWDYPTTQPAKIPNRKGLLTHPAWLIAHSLNLETDPVRRGKWIREKLLAGTILDVPITVDAVIPEDPHKTLRQRLEKRTSDVYCWSCHQKMDPLGLAFESYDDFGRFRTHERLEHEENLITPKKKAPRIDGVQLPVYKKLPVNASGMLEGTGDSSLDGQVSDALDMVERLAQSVKVRQSIIRHAFRYFLGRNELLSDSKTLIDADQAYVKSGGSFDAVIVSLLTSDSFIYRKK